MISVRKQSKKRGKGIAGIASLLPGPNSVKVGFVAGEAEPDVIQRAIWQEFGTKGSGKPFVRKGKGGKVMGGFGGPIPERPAVRNALRGGQATSKSLLKSEAAQIVQNAAAGRSAATSKRSALRRLGVKVKTDIQTEIVALKSPPNAPITIALKGSSNPLIDSGEMLKSVGWEIKD